MKSKSNKLIFKVWLYLICFCSLILVFLYLMQIVLLNAYYEKYKVSQLDSVAKKINKEKNLTEEFIGNLAVENEICISFYNNGVISFVSNYFTRGCISTETLTTSSKFKQFLDSDSSEHTFTIVNPRYKNKTLIKAIKLSNNSAIFLNSSVEPIDTSINLLKSQFIYIAVIIFMFSLIISYFISRQITNPIVKISNAAKKMAKGNYDVSFNTDSKISEIKELTTTLEMAKEELSKTDELRRDLMANVSHDLKTPLTMIKAYAEMIRDFSSQSKKKRDENLNIIISETDKLTVLVNDILELSKMQSTSENIVREEFDINKTILDVLKRFDILIEKEGYKFIYENKEKIIVNADKKQLEQVLYNLINNAINYTGKDKTVYIILENEKNVLRINIKDTGKGIDKKELNYIWDKYYHNEKKHKRNTRGTGLGLSIVKNILEKHGFKYGVNSEKNKGSTFYFEIEKLK